jgi:hypothetical protein
MNIVVLRGEFLGLRGRKPSMMESFIEGIATGEIAVRDVSSRSGASKGRRRNAAR